jgi:hypothetical protein
VGGRLEITQTSGADVLTPASASVPLSTSTAAPECRAVVDQSRPHRLLPVGPCRVEVADGHVDGAASLEARQMILA